MATFSERLRQLRHEKGVSQAELGAAVGLSYSSISMYESHGKRYPPIKVLQKLADYFGCSVDYLLGRTDYRQGAAEELHATWPNGLHILYRASKEATPEQKRIITAIIKAVLEQNQEDHHRDGARPER
ncbi:MAG: helix-turn-helix transcriptional regulator [Thermodesulfobacteriota bacterium]